MNEASSGEPGDKGHGRERVHRQQTCLNASRAWRSEPWIPTWQSWPGDQCVGAGWEMLWDNRRGKNKGVRNCFLTPSSTW